MTRVRGIDVHGNAYLVEQLLDGAKGIRLRKMVKQETRVHSAAKRLRQAVSIDVVDK